MCGHVKRVIFNLDLDLLSDSDTVLPTWQGPGYTNRHFIVFSTQMERTSNDVEDNSDF